MDQVSPNTSVVVPQVPVEPTNSVAPITQQQPVPTQPSVNYAGFGRRFMAVFVDGIVVGIFNFVASIFFGSIFSGVGGSGFNLSGFPAIISSVLMVAYYIFFIGKYGQTLGKIALKIKVVDINTNLPPGYMGAFLRELVGKFLSAFLLLGYFWMIWDAKKQTWHDKIAGTVVVRV